jgi:hypothetical protein
MLKKEWKKLIILNNKFYSTNFKPTWSIKEFLIDFEKDKTIISSERFDKICDLSKLKFEKNEHESLLNDLSNMIIVSFFL